MSITTIRCSARSRRHSANSPASTANCRGASTAAPRRTSRCRCPAFARALAKLAAPQTLASQRGNAARRIVRAMIAHPELVSGTGRACAILMRSARGRAAVKTGAEGYFAGIVPEAGLGIALKIDDGAGARVRNGDRRDPRQARPSGRRRSGACDPQRAGHQHAQRHRRRTTPGRGVGGDEFQDLIGLHKDHEIVMARSIAGP